MKQIATRLSPEEYQAFNEARGEASESAFLIELVQQFFEGGCLQTPAHRLNNLREKLNELEKRVKQSA